jgi:hypothetical protein
MIPVVMIPYNNDQLLSGATLLYSLKCYRFERLALSQKQVFALDPAESIIKNFMSSY